jgi:hypothetical protein
MRSVEADVLSSALEGEAVSAQSSVLSYFHLTSLRVMRLGGKAS